MAAVTSCENVLSSQEKLKTMVTQNFRGDKKIITVFF